MKAIVCDKCGKVNLLEDERPYMYPSGVFRLVNDTDSSVIDLCEDCANEMVAAIRKADHYCSYGERKVEEDDG